MSVSLPSSQRPKETPDAEACVVLTTAPEASVAERLASTLVEEHLAGCVQLVEPIRSFYRWRGKVTEDREILLVIKTRRALFDQLCDRVRQLHSYDTPELVLLEARAEAEYARWLGDATRPQRQA